MSNSATATATATILCPTGKAFKDPQYGAFIFRLASTNTWLQTALEYHMAEKAPVPISGLGPHELEILNLLVTVMDETEQHSCMGNLQCKEACEVLLAAYPWLEQRDQLFAYYHAGGEIPEW